MSTYRERLYPKWWVYTLAAALVGMLSIAYGAAYQENVGWLMFIVGFGLVSLGMTTGSPVIEVAQCLRVDNATLPLFVIDSTEVLNADQIRALRRSRDHATDFTVVKLWSSTKAIAIALDDPLDPHPGWLISTRHPQALKSAIDSAIAQSGKTSPSSDTV